MTMWWQSAGASLILIALAEIGDKSQLVCMTLAARHGRGRPVLFGAMLAFSLLNTAAVLFGAAVAAWLPKVWVLSVVAVLFAVFGVQSLLDKGQDKQNERQSMSSHGLFVTAFLMILFAEMGDKTQIAVAGLAGTYAATAVWAGAMTALACTTMAGVFAGKTVICHLPVLWLNRLAGVIFLALAGLALWRVLSFI